MMREMFAVSLVMVTINAGLLLTTDFTEESGFNFFPSGINQVLPTDSSTDLNPTTIDAVLDPNSGGVFGFAAWLFSLGINGIKIVLFLLTGSIQIALLVDPSASWIGIVIAPIALINTFGVIFVIISFIGALRGGF